LCPPRGQREPELADAAQLASLADETPEGRSIVTSPSSASICASAMCMRSKAQFVHFSAQTRMSGVDVHGRQIRKGATDAIRQHVEAIGGAMPASVLTAVEAAARRGSTPLVVADGNRVLGVVEFKDVVKGGIKERFAELRQMGSRR
jgi:K+-transporting ATPase ATPase B chain